MPSYFSLPMAVCHWKSKFSSFLGTQQIFLIPCVASRLKLCGASAKSKNSPTHEKWPYRGHRLSKEGCPKNGQKRKDDDEGVRPSQGQGPASSGRPSVFGSFSGRKHPSAAFFIVRCFRSVPFRHGRGFVLLLLPRFFRCRRNYCWWSSDGSAAAASTTSLLFEHFTGVCWSLPLAAGRSGFR